jgi:hypothetical protein
LSGLPKLIDAFTPIDLAGVWDLLDRLQSPLELQIHDDRPPVISPEFLFVFELGGVSYWRSTDQSWWLLAKDTGGVAHLIAPLQQLHLWPDPHQPTQRYFWHSVMRSAIAIYLSDYGYTPIHAAAMVDPIGQLWLLGGYTHAGKSTLTIGLLEAGWSYLGDDGVLLADDHLGVVAHSWWGSSLLDPILATTYPHLATHLGDWVGNRRLINLQNCYADQYLTHQIPIKLAFPQIDQTEPLAKLVPLSPGLALAQLMQHSAPWLLKNPQTHLGRLQALCLQSEYFTLHVGMIARTKPHQVANVLR